jgi:hypothetical protein
MTFTGAFTAPHGSFPSHLSPILLLPGLLREATHTTRQQDKSNNRRDERGRELFDPVHGTAHFDWFSVE